MSLPVYRSGVNDFRVEVYETDRDNGPGRELGDAVLHVEHDWDIDRAGSKSRVDIETHLGVLKPNMWIAPYITITPESGEIVRQQMGHFRLGRPGVTHDGTVDPYGNPAKHQRASGADIIDDIAAFRLPEAFYTPINGVPMDDIRVLIKMATSGQMGPNLLANGSFESESANWPVTLGWGGGGSGSISWGPVPGGWAMPDGTKGWGPTFNAGVPAGANVYARQNVSIPPAASHLYMSGVAFPHTSGGYAQWMSVIFADETDTNITGFIDVGSRTVQLAGNRFSRIFGVVPVPVGAAIARVFVYVEDKVGGRTSAQRVIWDDVRVGTCTTMPLPDDRIRLPLSSAVATTRIQTGAGKSIGYDAINADRAAAIGHHAIYTDMTGAIITSPLRNTASASPSRTYGPGDYRFVDVIEILPGDANVPNHFIAIKEDFENGANSLRANSYNNNPNDEFSVINTRRVISADPIMVQDAVDLTALQAVADSARDRVSAQEELRMSVLPDPPLQVHDVIRIEDPDHPEAFGNWAVEYLRPGLNPADPVVEIGARRAIGGGS